MLPEECLELLTESFISILNLSIASTWIVLAILIVRLLLIKVPKRITSFLWGILGLRLILPSSFKSILCLIPSMETIPEIFASYGQAIYGTWTVYTGINSVDNIIEAPYKWDFDPTVAARHCSYLWIIVMAFLLIYGVVSYIRIASKLRASVFDHDNVYYCDNIKSPFVFGIIRARIYVPFGLSDEELRFVIAHENAHIKRRDYLWKPLGFVLLAINWFNPFLWISYFLLCYDTEKACDEQVVANLDFDGRKSYANVLLNCSFFKRSSMIYPVAFGEMCLRSRIKAVLRYKSPTTFKKLVSTALCVVLCICFLSDPIDRRIVNSTQDGIYILNILAPSQEEWSRVKADYERNYSPIVADDLNVKKYILIETGYSVKDCRVRRNWISKAGEPFICDCTGMVRTQDDNILIDIEYDVYNHVNTPEWKENYPLIEYQVCVTDTDDYTHWYYLKTDVSQCQF